MNFDLLFNLLTTLSVVTLILVIVAQFVSEKGRIEYE